MKKNWALYILMVIAAGVILYAGLSGTRIWFIRTPRAAAISLGVVGMILCGSGSGLERMVTKAPGHPMAILGYLVGATGLFAFLTQVFAWQVPFVGEPRNALIVLALVIAVKFMIARFSVLIPGLR